MHTVHYRARIPIPCAENMPVLSVSELETNHSTDARVAGAGPAGREADGSRGMDGPCRSRGPNQKEVEPIRDSVPCPSRDGGGGPPGPGDVGPPRCPTRTESPGATAGPLRCRRARVQIAVAPGGDSRSATDADERHGRHHPYSASCRPHHRVTARRVRCARGLVWGVGSVS